MLLFVIFSLAFLFAIKSRNQLETDLKSLTDQKLQVFRNNLQTINSERQESQET